MFDDPPEAIDVLLEHGWVEISDFTYMPPSDTPSQFEQDAIQYLVEEWDYGYCPRDAAPIEPLPAADRGMLEWCDLWGLPATEDR